MGTIFSQSVGELARVGITNKDCFRQGWKFTWISLGFKQNKFYFIGTSLVLIKPTTVCTSSIKEVEDSVRCATISSIISRIRKTSQHSHNELPVKSN